MPAPVHLTVDVLRSKNSLRAMAQAVAAMRSDIDAAMARLRGVRMQLTSLALGFNLAVKAEDERKAVR